MAPRLVLNGAMDERNPFAVLQRRMRKLGTLLKLLCLAWIVTVGVILIAELTPEDLHNHRSAAVQDQVHGCAGEFTERFACTQELLLSGERHSALSVLERLGVVIILPSIAWTVWRVVMWWIRRVLWPPAVPVKWAPDHHG